MTKKIIKVFEVIGGIAAGLMFLTVLWQVAARVIFRVSSTWTVEVGRALFVVMIFSGAPVLLYRDSHMAIRTILEKLHGKSLNIVSLIIDIAVLITLIMLSYGCYNRVIETWNDVIPTVEWLSSGKIYLVMLIGSLGMVYMDVLRIKSHIFDIRKEG